MESTAEVFRRLSKPLVARPTGVEPRLVSIPGIRAVLFDIYGTLLISGSGDIGSVSGWSREDAAASLLAALELGIVSSPLELVATLDATIGTHHATARESGIDHPEVDVRDVWRDVLGRLIDSPSGVLAGNPCGLTQLACEFEARANPVWPMPGIEPLLSALSLRDLHLGLISNAQFFTPELFPALLGRSLDELGFDSCLRFYSYECRYAKPSTWMFDRASESLASRRIVPAEVLYVGNDMRNDVWPATKVGFRTALFAGDGRSLRKRLDYPWLANIQPDAVVTELTQILQVIAVEPI